MTQPRLRLFVAAALPCDVLEAVDGAMAPLRARLDDARWTAPESRHLTLKFLGSTPTKLTRSIGEIVGGVAHRVPPGRVRPAGVGAFPKLTRARVLWVGIEDPHRTLVDLAGGLSDGLEALGYEAERHPYVPHLTLARFKVPAAIEPPLPALDDLPELTLDEIGLYSSHLSPRGARYERLQTFTLEGQ